MNDENTFFDHISHLFPYRAPAMRSTDKILLQRAFFPMSTDTMNQINARNKQLVANAMKTSEDKALFHQLQYLLNHFLLLPMKKEDFLDKTKLIRKRYSSFLPTYVGRIYNRMNTDPSHKVSILLKCIWTCKKVDLKLKCYIIVNERFINWIFKAEIIYENCLSYFYG